MISIDLGRGEVPEIIHEFIYLVGKRCKLVAFGRRYRHGMYPHEVRVSHFGINQKIGVQTGKVELDSPKFGFMGGLGRVNWNLPP